MRDPARRSSKALDPATPITVRHVGPRAILALGVAACTAASPRPSATSMSRSVATEPAPPARRQVEPMVPIAGGSLVRGRDDAERADERPRHTVHLRPFAIDPTLVTRAAFAQFVAETGFVTSAERAGFGVAAREGMDDWAWERVPHGSWRRPFIGRRDVEPDADTRGFLRDDAPVVMVSYSDAVAFCAHRGARLPTEAEWEYAMRAGREGARFPWGDEPTLATDGGPSADAPLGLNFWQGTSHHHNARRDGFVYVSPVRAFPPNRWGIYDPVGNVWQWTADFYAADTYARSDDATDPSGPPSGKTRVLRGGSWWCGTCTCAGYGLHYRGKANPEAAFNNNGFRCAKS